MGVNKRILNNSKLEEIHKEIHPGSMWTSAAPEFIFRYHDQKIAKVCFIDVNAEVIVRETYSPWSYVSNDKGTFFSRIHRVEDQIHGVDIIDTDNLQSMFMELSVNSTPVKVKLQSSSFADYLNNDISYAIKSISKLIK